VEPVVSGRRRFPSEPRRAAYLRARLPGAAVREAYLPTLAHQQRAHRTLAGYFGNGQQGQRQLEELPWQLAEAGDWEGLGVLLQSRSFFKALWSLNYCDVKTYWAKVEASSSFRMTDAYRPLIDNPIEETDRQFARMIASLLQAAGHLKEIKKIQQTEMDYKTAAAIARAREGEEKKTKWENVDEERRYLEQSISRKSAIRTDLESELADSRNNQALILQAQGDLDGAMDLYRKNEQVYRKPGSMDSLATTLGNQASILMVRGDEDGALPLVKEQERIYREQGNLDLLAHCLSNYGPLLRRRGDLDGATSLLKEAELIYRQLGQRDRVAAARSREPLYAGCKLVILLRNQMLHTNCWELLRSCP